MLLNGQFPSTMLAWLGWPEADHLRLVPAAATSLTRLAAKFERDHGRPLYITDAYRTLASQVSLKIIKGVFAATPGTSNHGIGLAVDLASRINVDGSAEHRWMETNGPAFGWINPAWAVDFNPANGQHEPWHWEYRAPLDRSPFAPTAATPTPLTLEDDMTPDQANQLAFVFNALKVPGQAFGYPEALNNKIDALTATLDDTHRRIRGPESQPYDEIQALRAHMTAALDALGKIASGAPQDGARIAQDVLDGLAARLRD